jgi:hypothetical protein
VVIRCSLQIVLDNQPFPVVDFPEMPEKRKREYPNKNRPSTAISFDADQLVLLNRIADADDRSLASLVRHACKFWLQSAEGRELARKASAQHSLKTNIMLPALVEPSTPEEKS